MKVAMADDAAAVATPTPLTPSTPLGNDVVTAVFFEMGENVRALTDSVDQLQTERTDLRNVVAGQRAQLVKLQHAAEQQLQALQQLRNDMKSLFMLGVAFFGLYIAYRQ